MREKAKEAARKTAREEEKVVTGGLYLREESIGEAEMKGGERNCAAARAMTA